MRLPKISSYGQYSSGNYGAHCLLVTIGDCDLYFSYQTLVAFCHPTTGLVVRENDWGPTTGKHLNWIDGGNKKKRISGEEFAEKWLTIQKELV